MHNSILDNNNDSQENNKPIGIQREEAIVKSYRSEIDLLKEMMRSTRDESITGMNVWHHLWNALCSVSGDEKYDVAWLDEWEYLMKVFHTCNEKLLDLPAEQRLPLLQDITRISSLFKTTPWNQKQFHWSRELLEKIFDIAWVDKSLPQSEKTILFFSKMERE